MNTSLTDLFEVSGALDPKQTMIAKILLHTTDKDNDPQDAPYKELAKKLDAEEISIEDAEAALQAMTDVNIEEDVETYIAPKSSTDKVDMKKKIKADPSKSSTEKAAITKAIDDAKPGEEVVAEEYDDEGRMAKSDLLKLTQYSAKLYKALGDNDQLPGWIQAKITLAADYIGTVKHYLEGEQAMGGHDAPEGQIQEAKEDTEYYNWEDLHLAIFVTEDKPLEDVPLKVYLPTGTDAIKVLNLNKIIEMMKLPEGYESQFGTKEELIKREIGYVEKQFYAWKDSFQEMEGDEEVKVVCDDTNSTVYVDAIQQMADRYSAGKAKGNTKDVYETSILKMLSK